MKQVHTHTQQSLIFVLANTQTISNAIELNIFNRFYTHNSNKWKIVVDKTHLLAKQIFICICMCVCMSACVCVCMFVHILYKLLCGTVKNHQNVASI